MPGNYAHNRFGRCGVEKLPADVQRPIQRFRRFYDVGLHGPDIFFFHNVLWRDPVVKLGHAVHGKTGREFFTAACAAWKAAPSEAASAYLYGLLGHYCLDCVCHPYVEEMVATGKVSHTELETDFDRHLLRLDGKVPAHLHNACAHLKLTRGECVTAAQFFEPATPAQVQRSVRSMARSTRLLATKRRKLLEAVLRPAGESVRHQVMHIKPNPRCEGMHARFLELYDMALERYPRLLSQLKLCMESGEPLGEDFSPTFG